METIVATDQKIVCEGPGCHVLVEQQPGGHRRRRFCSNDCKQRAYRERVHEREEQEFRERWSDFLPETQAYLQGLTKKNDDRRELVEGIVETIKRECGEQRQATGDQMQYGQWLMECGKRLKYCPLPLEKYKKLFPGLFEETDIHDIQGDRLRWEAAASSFSPEALLVALVHVHQAEFLDRLLTQERSIASEQAFHAKIMLEAAQRDSRDYSMRLSRAEKRLREVLQDLEEEQTRRRELEQKSIEGRRDQRQREAQLLKDLQAVHINVASADLLETPYGMALLVVKEREKEIQHLKTRIEKQYERKIQRQQTRIAELESQLEQRVQVDAREREAIGSINNAGVLS